MEQSKSEVAINWIAHGLLRVHFDPRRKEAIVPAHLRDKHEVVFEWGFDLPQSIPDLKIDPDSIRGTLSFPGGLRTHCVVPWSIVFALSSPVLDTAKVWLNDAPAEAQRKILKAAGAQANAQAKSMRKSTKQMKSHLRLVKKGTGT